MALCNDDRVIGVVQANAASLLSLARRHSLCEDDAADAYQRTLEIYLRRVERIDPATAGSWLRTVCKHEAMRIRAAQQRVLPPEPVEWDASPSVEARDVEERAASLERVARAAEALQACKPEEARAILLRAGGASYGEIGEACDWSYSKVNRFLATGRARFLARFARIESGEACGGHFPVLCAIVDGEATPEDFLTVRPHLRHCASCRAMLRAMYDAEAPLGALLPAGGLVALAASAGHDPAPVLAGHDSVAHAAASLSRAHEAVLAVGGRAHDAVLAAAGERAVRLQGLLEAVTSSKAAAVVVSAAAVATGGAAVERAATSQPPRARPAAVTAHRVRALSRPAVTPAPARTPAPVATSPPAPSATPTAVPTPEPSPTAPPSASPAPVATEFAAVEEAPQRRERASPAGELGPEAGGSGSAAPAGGGSPGEVFGLDG